MSLEAEARALVEEALSGVTGPAARLHGSVLAARACLVVGADTAAETLLRDMLEAINDIVAAGEAMTPKLVDLQKRLSR